MNTSGASLQYMRISNLLGKPKVKIAKHQIRSCKSSRTTSSILTILTPPRAQSPRYTLPLINAMPPSSTDVTEDDDTSSSAISELNPDRFTHSGGDDDASSDSTPNVTTPKSPCKRRRLATSTWQLARDPLPYETIRDSKNRIWYCLMWAYGDECIIRGFGGPGRI